MSRRSAFASRVRSAGFSLVEVLVALIVLSVGLLGIAKMEALALSNTSVASRRSLASIEAASLADSMHANRGYWSTAANVNITVTGTQVTNAPGNTAIDCTTVACAAVDLASYDLESWAKALNFLLPDDQATVGCNQATPLECTITIQWSEQALGLNKAQVQTTSTPANETAANTTIQNPTYTLYVEP